MVCYFKYFFLFSVVVMLHYIKHESRISLPNGGYMDWESNLMYLLFIYALLSCMNGYTGVIYKNGYIILTLMI